MLLMLVVSFCKYEFNKYINIFIGFTSNLLTEYHI